MLSSRIFQIECWGNHSHLDSEKGYIFFFSEPAFQPLQLLTVNPDKLNSPGLGVALILSASPSAVPLITGQSAYGEGGRGAAVEGKEVLG